jgi:hypothetical protein
MAKNKTNFRYIIKNFHQQGIKEYTMGKRGMTVLKTYRNSTQIKTFGPDLFLANPS